MLSRLTWFVDGRWKEEEDGCDVFGLSIIATIGAEEKQYPLSSSSSASYVDVMSNGLGELTPP